VPGIIYWPPWLRIDGLMTDAILTTVTIIILVIYGLSLLFILSYSIAQAHLVHLYLTSKRQKPQVANRSIAAIMPNQYPFVTIQLPIFNELYVVERIIDAVVAFLYPIDRFEVQVLDDSSDETVSLVESKVTELRAKGLNIQHIRRGTRAGFKAGALAYGLQDAKGEFIAIFDADFIPPADFLLKTLPYFQDEKVGLVQTKWEHVNEGYSLLTRLQAFGLDAHFTVEQRGRNAGGHFMNFNGTAGIWRKICIIDAGNWQSDTLTEDLDLSYRAQLKGWKFLYLEHVESPAELPVTMSALKTQQFRWTKGAAECVKKNLPSVLTSKHTSGTTKAHAIFHLMNCTVFICIFLAAVLSIPLLFIKSSHPQYAQIFLFALFSPFSLLLLSYFYWISATQRPGVSLASFLGKFLLFLSVSMGFSLHNSIALCEGYAGKKIPFIRTPKFNITSSKDKWQANKYLVNNINGVTMLEALLAMYFFTGIFLSIYFQNYGLLPFYIMLTLGFGYVFYYSIVHAVITVKHANG
jgi:cellulose synthase/poly-beta-1,6-N-acetylglucosamine synthase-like glycosyltransferase